MSLVNKIPQVGYICNNNEFMMVSAQFEYIHECIYGHIINSFLEMFCIGGFCGGCGGMRTPLIFS